MNTKTAVILASGMGTRIREYEESKPLTVVCGLPLIIRTILALQISGIKRVVVVVGYKKDLIINAIKKEKRIKIVVEFVENPDYRLSNGISLLKAEDKIDGNFMLLMSDHVFDPKILKGLNETPINDNGAILCVDFNVERTFDLDDATKVLVKNNKIVDIGKKIKNYNAIDTGIFLCTKEVFTALHKAKEENGGDCSLSDGMKKLASENRFGAYDIGNAYWQDVDDIRMLKHAEEMLYNSLKKDVDGIVAKHINRKVSIFLTKHFFIKTGLTPNMITVIAFLIGVLGSVFIILGAHSYLLTLIGALLFQFSSIVDGNDGEIARLKFMFSKTGEWLDTILDDLNNAIFFLAMGISLYLRHDAKIYLIMGILSFIFFYYYNYVVYSQLLSLKDKPGSVFEFKWWFETKNAAYRAHRGSLTDLVRILARRDFYIFVFFILALLNLLEVALIYAFIMALVHFVASIIHQVKKGVL